MAHEDWPEWEDDAPIPVVANVPTPGHGPTPFQWVEPENVPRREWLYGRHLLRRFISTTISPGGLGKSSLLLAEALCMASGEAKLGDRLHAGPLNVWYWNGEDPQDETQRRVVAAAKVHEIPPASFVSRLWTDSGREMRIKLASMTRGEIDVDEDMFLSLELSIKTAKIDVLILDPFISAHNVSENDNGAIDNIVKRLGILAERCNCAVELVHHVRKPGAGVSSSTDVNDARGASALIGGVRSARVLNVMSEDEAGMVKIDPQHRHSFFRVDNGKANLAPRSDKASWRQIVSYDMNNGGPALDSSDHIGVVKSYVLPGAFDKVASNAADVAVDIAHRNPQARHYSGRGKKPADWFGYLVAPHIGLDEVNDVATLRTLIDAWIKSGLIRVENRQDSSRNMVAFIAPGIQDIHAPQPFTDPEDDLPF